MDMTDFVQQRPTAHMERKCGIVANDKVLFASTPKGAIPGEEPGAPQEHVIEFDENDIVEIEARAAECEQFAKAFIYSIECDMEKREITITLPRGENQLTLSEDWAQALTTQLTNQIHEWRCNQ